MYGIYGAFDRKKTDLGNFFNQLTFGVEGWFQKLFVGGNYYQPVGSASKLVGYYNEKAEYDRVQNNVWFTADKQSERAMGGGDAEFGYEFIEGLTAYIGGYYFTAKGIDSISGPKARIAYDWALDNGKKIAGVFDKIGLEVGGQNDKRGSTYYVSANIRIGLLPNRDINLQGAARHMVDLVRRDVDIISNVAQDPVREVCRDAGRAQKIASFLQGKNIFVSSIRPPTVPANTARLRISLTVNHTEEDVDYLLEMLSDILSGGC